MHGVPPLAHGGKLDKMLKDQPQALCMKCHPGVGKEGDTVHAPVASGDCLTCHAYSTARRIAGRW